VTRNFRVLLVRDPDSWVTYVPALNFLSTFGDTRDDALEHTREAILLYLEGAEDDARE
jgi:predicted RNase H-like HicB family nuclease